METVYKVLLCTVAFATIAPRASATAISGQFEMSGIVTMSNTGFTWTTDAPGNAADLFTLSLGTGSFTPESGQNGVLDLTSKPVRALFPQHLMYTD